MPFVVAHNPVLARSLTAALLSALDTIPGAALLVTPFVHLYTAGPSPITPDSVPGDFVEATFVGYASIALPLPLIGPINLAFTTLGVNEEVNFLAGAVVPPGENILGYWISNQAGAAGTLYMAETFADPIPIAVAGDFISLDAIFAIAMQTAF